LGVIVVSPELSRRVGRVASLLAVEDQDKFDRLTVEFEKSETFSDLPKWCQDWIIEVERREGILFQEMPRSEGD